MMCFYHEWSHLSVIKENDNCYLELMCMCRKNQNGHVKSGFCTVIILNWMRTADMHSTHHSVYRHEPCFKAAAPFLCKCFVSFILMVGLSTHFIPVIAFGLYSECALWLLALLARWREWAHKVLPSSATWICFKCQQFTGTQAGRGRGKCQVMIFKLMAFSLFEEATVSWCWLEKVASWNWSPDEQTGIVF